MAPKIVVRDLSKSFPDGRGGARVVLDHVSFTLEDGAFVSIIGPSGGGKSTTLNIIAGLVTPDAGQVELSGRAVTSAALQRTPVGYVFQQPRLPFSHLDEITSTRLRAELMEIWARTGKTILFVTHDISESVLLSDRVLVLGRGGRVLSDETIDVPRPRASEEARLFEIERRMRVLAAAWWAEPEAP